MTREVFDGVLPFAERIIGGRIDHPSPMLNGVLVVTIDIFHPYHHGIGASADRIPLFSYSYRAVADVQLCPVTCNSQPQGEAECIAKPVDRRAHIRIRKHRNDSAPRHRPILEH